VHDLVADLVDTMEIRQEKEPSPLRSFPRESLRMGMVTLLAVALAWAAVGDSVYAQRSGQEREKLKGVGVTQKLGASIPANLSFRNEAGESVRLGQYFDGSTPVILTFNYHRCPQLCKIQLRKFAESVSGLSWTPGEKFKIVTIDINPDEGPEMARTAQKRYRTPFEQPEAALAGWHFLTGDADAIQSLTDSVGFRYRRLTDRNQQFAHPTTLVFASGSGTITRYFSTLDPDPGNLRTAVVEASDGQVGSLADQVFLACARFNPDTNSYSASAFKVMQYGSILLTLVMGTALFIFWRREKKEQDAASEEPDAALDAALRKRT